MSSFASDQVIPFSVPRAASPPSLGHPILFDWPPHLSHQVIPLGSRPSVVPPWDHPIPIFTHLPLYSHTHWPVGLSSFGQLMALDPALSHSILNDVICLSQPRLYHDTIRHRVSSVSSHHAASMFISSQPSPRAGPVLVSELSHCWEFLRVEVVEPQQAAPFKCQRVVREPVLFKGW